MRITAWMPTRIAKVISLMSKCPLVMMHSHSVHLSTVLYAPPGRIVLTQALDYDTNAFQSWVTISPFLTLVPVTWLDQKGMSGSISLCILAFRHHLTAIQAPSNFLAWSVCRQIRVVIGSGTGERERTAMQA